jgi:uncharacterized protein YdiU (UPF0061 family)
VSATAASLLPFAQPTFARELEGLHVPWQAAPVPAPELLVLDDDLAVQLGADPAALRAEDGLATLLGARVPDGQQPVAMGYAGHQFGAFSPRLGDGRALLLGEVVDVHGRRRDVHLKGSGRTPWARGGDGKAAVGPMLREHLVGAALHALGVPTSRALAVVATGEAVRRETELPGAVLVRVAAGHLRVGTFEYVAHTLEDRDLLERLARYAIARHHPQAAEAERPALGLLDAVVAAQARLVAAWLHVGFVHGVMNTDNVAISGETLDLGPCAFVDAYDPAASFSSIDHAGRYALGMQPKVAHWDLARFAEALLALIDDDARAAAAAATEVLDTFGERFTRAFSDGMHRKLGLPGGLGTDEALGDDLLALLADQRVDWTAFWRALARAGRGDDAPVRALAAQPDALDAWLARWRALGPDPELMDRVNPVVIPRNHALDDALTQATVGDLAPYRRLLDAVTRPYDERPDLEDLAGPAPAAAGDFVTFCGT